MHRERWIIGNWKMNGSVASNAALLQAIRGAAPSGARLGVCVPTPYLAQTREQLQGSTVLWGAQDCSAHASGAYTGEVSAAMLVEFGCAMCIVGHSERRAYHGESNELVAAKARAVAAAGMRPVVCVGETLEQRDAGHTFAVVDAQLRTVLEQARDAARSMILAYEPVWAIGTGRSATPDQAQEVHAYLRGVLAANELGMTPVLYGGSVKASNAASLFAMPDIDGGLIGGASLVAEEFLSIASPGGAMAES
ncbi:MAG TPA: triose-phosphate isomerase [Burkholderiaceae bacterium]|nr:triose-phosphate isomerase [Burkholderiaceae bacterium]